MNATDAAKRAGYSEKTAYSIGNENLSKPEIAEYINKSLKKRLDGLEISQERVLNEMARVAFCDIRNLFDESGNLRPIHDLDDDTARAVASFEIVAVRGADGETEYLKKVKSADKMRGLEMLGKYLALFTDKHEHSGPGGKPIEITEIQRTIVDPKK